MRHLGSITIKFVMISLIFYLVLGLGYRFNFTSIVLMSLIITLLSYLVGDLFILPYAGNTVAAVADAGLAVFGIWILSRFYGLYIPWAAPVIIAVVLFAFSEWFFHRYVMDRRAIFR